MPIYSYHCEQCQTDFTELRRSSEMDTPIDCPKCSQHSTYRTLSCFSVGGTGISQTSSNSIPSGSSSHKWICLGLTSPINNWLSEKDFPKVCYWKKSERFLFLLLKNMIMFCRCYVDYILGNQWGYPFRKNGEVRWNQSDTVHNDSYK
jgi:putative FmdB family regulatory protein